ncbi:hypothetical protein Tco_0533471 [Tanacetum coccineum]
MICRHQGFMVKEMEKKYVTNHEFHGIKERADKVLHEIIPQVASKATNDLIDDNLPRVVANVAYKKEMIYKLITSTATTTYVDLQHQLYLKMKSNLQDQVADPELWDILKRKFEKSSASSEWDAWVEDTVKDKVIPEDETPDLIEEFQSIDKHVPTIFDHKRMKATLRDIMSNQFRDAECLPFGTIKELYGESDSVESRQESIRRSKPYAYVLYGPQRNSNEPLRYLYNKDLFFLKYGNFEERKYVLSLYKIHVVPFPEEYLEEKMNPLG